MDNQPENLCSRHTHRTTAVTLAHAPRVNHSMCCMAVFTICGIICWNNEEICRNNGLKHWEQKNRIMGNFISIIGSSLQVATTSTGLGMRLTIHNIVFVPCTSVCSSNQLIQLLLAHAWTIGQTSFACKPFLPEQHKIKLVWPKLDTLQADLTVATVQ